MNKKKVFSTLLAFLMLFSATSCVDYKGINNSSNSHHANSSGTNNDSAGGNQDSNDANSSEETDEENDGYFSVRLSYKGQPFTQTNGLQAQWTDGTSIYRADFEDGVAKMAGLDGDYKVTVYGLPIVLLYDPNSHRASNDNQDITIELYTITQTDPKQKGTSMYDCIRVSEPGVYMTTLTSRSHTVFYEFAPRTSGTYTIETIMDTNENKVNPRFEIYAGTFAAKRFDHSIDDGGESGVYTRNPRYQVQVTQSMIGNVYTFAVRTEHRDGIFPTDVYFLINYVGEYDPPAIDKSIKIPDQAALANRGMITDEWILEKDGRTQKGVMTYPEVRISATSQDCRFISSMYGLSDIEGEDFYRVYNEETGKYDGPVLYAHITQPHRFFPPNQGAPVSFHIVEMVSGTAMLLLSSGTENYKLFIEGGASCVAQNVVGMEHCGGYQGLADYVFNDYGLYPVTEEVREFLQKFAEKELYFRDGQGWAETTAQADLGHRIYAAENDQWLFACCYFK
ncbi:MAG: hypothetical protein J6D30_02875 [Clostridia bacterium]|nr:hypothetical protein [Clostridia bacterium]